jgi:hypothetical protein
VALIFILVVGIMITAALNKTGGVLKTDYQVRAQAQEQYAVDAGVERALQVLRDDIASKHYCPTTTAANAPDVLMTGSSDTNSKDPGGMAFNVNLGDSNNPHSPLRVQYACHTLAGAVPDNNQFNNLAYSIVTTGGKTSGGVDDTLTTSNGHGVDLAVDGSIYLAGQEPNYTGPNADFKKNITVNDGDFIEYQSSDLKSCLTNVNNVAPSDGSGPVIVPPGTTHSVTCSADRPIDVVPTPNLPTAPAAPTPSFIDYPLTGAATCRVFFPGTYTSAPNLLTPHGGGAPEANYFVSGLYNFDGIGDWTIDNKAIVIGGQPNAGAGDQTVLPSGTADVSHTGCKDFVNSNDAVVKTTIRTLLGLSSSPAGEWDHGTLFVMGGTSTLDMKNGQLSLYTPATADGPASLMAARTDGWTPTGATDTNQGYTAWVGNATSSTVIGFQGAGNNVGFISNGQILAPDAPVSLTGTNGTTAAARAGIVGATVDVNATAAISGSSFYFQPFGGGGGPGNPPVRRTIKVVACVDPVNPAANCIASPTSTTFSEVAMATIENSPNVAQHIRVFSWRVCRQGCNTS